MFQPDRSYCVLLALYSYHIYLVPISLTATLALYSNSRRPEQIFEKFNIEEFQEELSSQCQFNSSHIHVTMILQCDLRVPFNLCKGQNHTSDTDQKERRPHISCSVLFTLNYSVLHRIKQNELLYKYISDSQIKQSDVNLPKK
jgi:hypothetical protein